MLLKSKPLLFIAIIFLATSLAIAGYIGTRIYTSYLNWQASLSSVWGSIRQLEIQNQQLETQYRFTTYNLSEDFVEHQQIRGDADFGDVPAAKLTAMLNGRWSKIAGDGEMDSWPSRYYIKTKALEVYDDDLCTGLLGPKSGDADIWCFDGKSWRQIGGDGLNGSWANNARYVTFLLADGQYLFAGVDETVWRFDGAAWEKIGDVSANMSGCIAYSGAMLDGDLYVGTMSCGFSLFKYDGSEFQSVSFSIPDNERNFLHQKYKGGIYELHPFQGKLYIGSIAKFGTAGVFSYSKDGKLSKIGGDGVNGSWINPGFSYLESFTTYRDTLVVSGNRMPIAPQQFVSVWALQNDGWHPVGSNNMPLQWGSMINFNAVTNFNDTLIVAGGGIPAGLASVWAFTGEKGFQKIAGHGINGSWGEETDGRMLPNSSAEYIYRLKIWRGKLVAGFGDSDGMAQIWQYEIAS